MKKYAVIDLFVNLRVRVVTIARYHLASLKAVVRVRLPVRVSVSKNTIDNTM